MSQTANGFFKKLSEEAVDRVADLRDPYATALFTMILRHIDRRTNSLVIPQDELADLAGMSPRTLRDKVKRLEQVGVIVCVRRKESTTKYAVNEYRLAGVAAAVMTTRQAVPADRQEVPVQRQEMPHISRENQIHHNDDDKYIDDDLREGFDETREQSDAAQTFLEAKGIRGWALEKAKQRPLEMIERAFAMAEQTAKHNPAGYALAILENGVFRNPETVPDAKPNPFAGMSWGDFAVQ